MASQSLYRKWRSQTFSDMVGQEAVIRTLKNGLNSGTLAHAYLFTGPRGTGKTSMARLLAKTINCLNPKDGEPCNICDQCREITTGSSFNVIEIDAASNRGIDSIRELRDKVMMPPATGKYKVYILDEAHMLTTEAFNALLKTLEEPPPHAIFVMATTDVHKMLPTVISRCQCFSFKRFTLHQLIDHLNYVATQEQVVLERGAAELLARAASGGMRDALSLLDQAIAYAGRSISLAQIQTMLGVADPHAIEKLVLHIAQLESPEGLHLIHELTEAGADLRQINTQLAEYFRAMMLARAGANIAEILDSTADEINEIQQASQAFALEELTECARVFAQNELMQKNVATPQLGLELALLASVELHRRHGGGTEAGAVKRSVSSGATPPQNIQNIRTFEPSIRQQSASPSLPAHREPSSSTPVPQVSLPIQSAPLPPVSLEVPSLPPAVLPTSNEVDDDHDDVSMDETLPEWDTISYADDEEEPDEEPVASEPSRSPEPQTRVVAPPPPSPPVMPSPVPLVPSVPEPVAAQHSTEPSPTLTVQDVKEKWEYIKRRVRSQSTKGGPMIQALLNQYTVVAIEGSHALPVVVLQAGADFHFKQLQNNEERRKVIEWALKVELGLECRVRLVPPGQLGSSMAIPPPPAPSDGSSGSALYSSMRSLPRNSAFQERPPIEKLSPPKPSPVPESKTSVRSSTSLAPAQDMQTLVSTPIPLHPESRAQTPPLARMQGVRENSNEGKTRPEERPFNRQAHVEQQAKSDPVVQEVLRLFKAEIKEIRPK